MIIMLSVIEVVVVMYWTRRRDEQPNHDATLLEFCRAEIARLDRQIRLLRSVTWWYSGPMLLGACVMILRLLSAVPELPALVVYGFLAAFYACFLAAVIIIHRGSSRTVESTLVPFRDEFAELVRSVDDGISENNSESNAP